MWNVLFPNWKNYKVLYFKKDGKPLLEKLCDQPFTLKLVKRCPSHLLFFLAFREEEVSLCLKLYFNRSFKRNRVKAFIQNYNHLTKLKIPLIEPFFIFYLPFFKTLLKRSPFLGGILFPYFNQGFLEERDIIENSKINYSLLSKLIKFIYDLHEKGVLLRDTKYNNFYYRMEEEFKLFDLDGLKILQKKPSPKRRLKDLASLAMTLNWIGFSQAETYIFKTYQKFFPSISHKDYCLFQNFVKIRKEKRLQRIKSLSYKQDSKTFLLI